MNITAYLTGGLALAVAVVYGLWTYDSHINAAKLETAQAMLDVAAQQIAQAKAANESNVATLTAIQADLARQQAAATKFEALARDRAAALWQAKKRIQDAPKTDDAPTAPVLRDELQSLVRPSVPPPNGTDANPNGAPANDNEPVVPAATGTTGS